MLTAGQIPSNAQFCRINAAFRPALGTPHLCGSEEFCRAPCSWKGFTWRLQSGARDSMLVERHMQAPNAFGADVT
jgi:hypothetical protein